MARQPSHDWFETTCFRNDSGIQRGALFSNMYLPGPAGYVRPYVSVNPSATTSAP